VELSVEDCGEGMAPAILARATEPFFTTKEIGKGTGLGLSMTHGVIKAHGGTLDIISSPGQGTTVKLRLPRIPAPVLVQPSAVPVASLGPLKVLLVDDDADIRFLVARMLKAAGLQVKSVAGGEEALAYLGTGALPDLIILDQNMPGMSGIQTLERIRILNAEVLILVSSGQPDIEEWACFQQPKVAVLSKPFEMEELLTKLARFSADR
jgi:CheY-like chemotaxis protein